MVIAAPKFADKQAQALALAPLVKRLAGRMATRLPRWMEPADLVQDGYLGLLDAVDRFEHGRGAQLATFATRRVQGAMLDSVRKQSWASRGARKRTAELHKAEEALAHKLGRAATAAELAAETGLTTAEIARRRREVEMARVSSLDSTVYGAEEQAPWESLVDDGAWVEVLVERAETSRLLREAVKTLSDRERQVLRMIYAEERTCKEVGAALGVSEPRVSQLHHRALKRLREVLEPQLKAA